MNIWTFCVYHTKFLQEFENLYNQSYRQTPVTSTVQPWSI